MYLPFDSQAIVNNSNIENIIDNQKERHLIILCQILKDLTLELIERVTNKGDDRNILS